MMNIDNDEQIRVKVRELYDALQKAIDEVLDELGYGSGIACGPDGCHGFWYDGDGNKLSKEEASRVLDLAQERWEERLP